MGYLYRQDDPHGIAQVPERDYGGEFYEDLWVDVRLCCKTIALVG